ncbi:MAG: tetratricopeptide repeat protein, partial [Myxococcales bacterium]|nr:tetratricopeptide repeat protein [Myxococcales bacterium]
MAEAIAFVAGATGYTGRAVVETLVARGVDTVAHVRPDSSRRAEWTQRWEALGARVDATAWEVSALRQTFVRIRPTLIFALLGTTRARARQEGRGATEAYEAIDYGLTMMLHEAAVACDHAPRLVYLSAAGVRPDTRNRYMAARARVERALRDTGSPLAAEAIERVIPALDAHATAWARQRISACEATRVRGEQSEALLDRRMACLERRRQQLEAVVGVLAAPDPEVVEHAVQTLDALGSLEACADLAALQAQYPPPEGEAMRAAVTALHARVAALEAAAKAGRASTMVQEARAVVEEAAALDYPPLQAEAHYARHLVDHLLAEHEPAIVEAVAAHRWATMVGDARTAWRAALAVARDVGRSARGTEDALRWLETARGWGERIELGAADRSHASRVRGEVLQHGDRVDEAIAELAGSLEQLEAESAPAGVLAGHHVGLAYLLRRAGRLDEARTHALQGIEQLEASLGQSHPEVARAYAILAQLEGARGDASSALTAIEHAVSIWRAITGESSMPHASALRERGDALTALGRFEPAIADYERALRILEALEHREPIEEVMTTVNLANTLSAQGQTTRALEFMERSLDRAIETFGADSVKVAEIRLNYGGDLAQAGRHEEGLEQSRLGLELLE